MIYIVLNAVPIALATFAGLLVGWFYLRIAGLTYAVFGLGLCLYFASQGAGRVGGAITAQGLRLREQANASGGHATLFIAASAHKQRAAATFDALKPPLDSIHRELKREFDPSGVFNPHRMYADW